MVLKKLRSLKFRKSYAKTFRGQLRRGLTGDGRRNLIKKKVSFKKIPSKIHG